VLAHLDEARGDTRAVERGTRAVVASRRYVGGDGLRASSAGGGGLLGGAGDGPDGFFVRRYITKEPRPANLKLGST
jgi:hypothetical protein